MVTGKDLQRWEACEDGYSWWIGNCEGLPTVKQIRKLQQHRPDWAVWLLCHVVPDPVGIAVFAAELVLPVYEREYPDDLRPRKAIDAAKARDVGAAGAAGAAAARAATRAATAATTAAAAAGAAAARAARRAATAATAAARATDAAGRAMPGAYGRIIEHGLKIRVG